MTRIGPCNSDEHHVRSGYNTPSPLELPLKIEPTDAGFRFADILWTWNQPRPPSCFLPFFFTGSSWASDTVVGYKDTAFYLEADSFDLCGGHATSGGIYHYHSTAGCLQEQAIAEAGVSAEGHSPVLGWAYVSTALLLLL